MILLMTLKMLFILGSGPARIDCLFLFVDIQTKLFTPHWRYCYTLLQQQPSHCSCYQGKFSEKYCQNNVKQKINRGTVFEVGQIRFYFSNISVYVLLSGLQITAYFGIFIIRVLEHFTLYTFVCYYFFLSQRVGEGYISIR